MTNDVVTDGQRPAPGATALYLARLSPGSRRAQTGALRDIASWFDGPWHGLTPAAVTAIRARVADRYAPSTGRRYMAALRGVLKEAWREGLLDGQTLARLLDVPPIRGSRPAPGRQVVREELAGLWSVANPRERAILAALVGAGLRRAEVATARLEGQTLEVLGKGNKTRRITIAGRVLDAVMASPPPWNIGGNGVWAMLRRVGQRAGIAHFSPHDLRRTYASVAFAAGVDVVTVQRAMGHSDPRVTSRYDRRADAQATAAAAIAAALDL